MLSTSLSLDSVFSLMLLHSSMFCTLHSEIDTLDSTLSQTMCAPLSHCSPSLTTYMNKTPTIFALGTFTTHTHTHTHTQIKKTLTIHTPTLCTHAHSPPTGTYHTMPSANSASTNMMHRRTLVMMIQALSSGLDGDSWLLLPLISPLLELEASGGRIVVSQSNPPTDAPLVSSQAPAENVDRATR
jgi:hypothetical protein